MKINNISNNVQIISNQVKDNKVKSEPTVKPTDKLEISAEAKSKLRESNRSQIGAIREKIAAGKYDTDDVIGKVVDFIVKDID